MAIPLRSVSMDDLECLGAETPMKCVHCGSRYSAAWAQPAPGGSSAPGVFLIIGLVVIGAAALALSLGHAYVGWTCLVIGTFVLLRVPFAWAACRNKAGLAPHGGGTCPRCYADNGVKIWSL